MTTSVWSHGSESLEQDSLEQDSLEQDFFEKARLQEKIGVDIWKRYRIYWGRRGKSRDKLVITRLLPINDLYIPRKYIPTYVLDYLEIPESQRSTEQVHRLKMYYLHPRIHKTILSTSTLRTREYRKRRRQEQDKQMQEEKIHEGQMYKEQLHDDGRHEIKIDGVDQYNADEMVSNECNDQIQNDELTDDIHNDELVTPIATELNNVGNKFNTMSRGIQAVFGVF